MGLGKTIQAISLLAYLACEEGSWGPHLIVVPTRCGGRGARAGWGERGRPDAGHWGGVSCHAAPAAHGQTFPQHPPPPRKPPQPLSHPPPPQRDAQLGDGVQEVVPRLQAADVLRQVRQGGTRPCWGFAVSVLIGERHGKGLTRRAPKGRPTAHARPCRPPPIRAPPRSAKERKAKRQGWSKPNAFHVCITSYTLVLQDAKVGAPGVCVCVKSGHWALARQERPPASTQQRHHRLLLQPSAALSFTPPTSTPTPTPSPPPHPPPTPPPPKDVPP
jgi:hypothetical protein